MKPLKLQLEVAEAWDSNRILDRGYRQGMPPYTFLSSYPVDHPTDIAHVGRNWSEHPIRGNYL